MLQSKRKTSGGLKHHQKRRWRQCHRCQRRNHYGGRRQKSGLVKRRRQLSWRRPKKRSEVSMIRYWVLLSEWCNQILWAKYILFIEIKGFWKILSSQKISSIGEIRKYWFSRLIIDESPPKKVSQFQFDNVKKLNFFRKISSYSRVIFHKEIFRICRIQSSSPICNLFQRVCRVGTSHCDGGRTTPRMIFKDGGSPIKSCWKVIEIQIETHFRNVYLIWFSKQPDFRQFQSNHGSPCACADSIRLCGFKTPYLS